MQAKAVCRKLGCIRLAELGIVLTSAAPFLSFVTILCLHMRTSAFAKQSCTRSTLRIESGMAQMTQFTGLAIFFNPVKLSCDTAGVPLLLNMLTVCSTRTTISI